MERLLSKTKAKELKALSSKKERDRQGLFVVEGEKSVVDTIEAFETEFLICRKSWIDAHPEILNRFDDKILIADSRGLEIVSSLNSLPDVIAIYKKPDFDGDLEGRSLDEDKLYVLLDEVQDPGNLGTIIRTCDWFGIYDIFASENTVDVYSPKVVQATMGSLSRVRVHYLDLAGLIKRNRGLKVYGTLLNGTPYDETGHDIKGFLLMGNEGRGISDPLKDLIDIPVTIPPVNKISHPDSLNVSIAAAIIISSFTSRLSR